MQVSPSSSARTRRDRELVRRATSAATGSIASATRSPSAAGTSSWPEWTRLFRCRTIRSSRVEKLARFDGQTIAERLGELDLDEEEHDVLSAELESLAHGRARRCRRGGGAPLARALGRHARPHPGDRRARHVQGRHAEPRRGDRRRRRPSRRGSRRRSPPSRRRTGASRCTHARVRRFRRGSPSWPCR